MTWKLEILRQYDPLNEPITITYPHKTFEGLFAQYLQHFHSVNTLNMKIYENSRQREDIEDLFRHYCEQLK